MKRKFFLILIFWWSMIFPSISFNNFTTDIISTNINYSDLSDSNERNKILKEADFTFWISEAFN